MSLEIRMSDYSQLQHCPSCSFLLSERGYFCASCAVQVRCKQCNELLEKDARACVMCGTATGMGAASPNVNGNKSPMNTVELQEDTRSRSLRISFTDAAIGSIGETVNQLVSDKFAPHGPRPLRPSGSSAAMSPLLSAGELRDGAQIIDRKQIAEPKLSSPVTGDAERMREIFEMDGEDIRLEEHRLKADSRLEYARRLTYLFIYSQELAGKKPIAYASVKKILEASKVLDNNTRHELSHKMAVEIDGDTIRLKKEGREKAVQALDEVLNPNHPDPGWTPESHARNPKAGGENKKDTKPTGKVGRKRSNVAEEWAAKWEKHGENVNGHFILKGKTVLDKAVLALWAIHKVGGSSASCLYIQRFIAVAFSFNEKERSLDTTFQRENAHEFVIKADGGYKLTPSGTKRAAEMAKAAK
jgi:hypothetical protein